MAAPYSLSRRVTAELFGTAALLTTVVGSGIMGEGLSAGNAALALLSNTLATGAALVVLIIILGPISGAHLNPAVTAVFALSGGLRARDAALYVIAQVAGAVVGVWLAHLMFEAPVFQTSTRLRDGPAQALSEFVAAFALVATILGALKFRPASIPYAVGLCIGAAYWFTASTSFANPAVTLARSLSDTFAGIAPSSVPAFVAAQLAGAAAAMFGFGWLAGEQRGRRHSGAGS